MVRKRNTRTVVTDVFGLTYSVNPINSKAKGDTNERQLCKWLNTYLGVPFIRTPSSGGRRLMNASNFCGDVVCEDENFNFPFAVETKHYKKFSFTQILRANSGIYKVYFQAKDDAIRANRGIFIALRNNGMPKNTWIMYFTFIIPNLDIISEGSPEEGVQIYGYHSNDILTINFDIIKNLNTFT